MWRTLILFVASGATVAGCGGSDDGGTGNDFDSLVESGATCAELFDVRNEIDPNSDRIEMMNEVLREIGCFSSTSTRTG